MQRQVPTITSARFSVEVPTGAVHRQVRGRASCDAISCSLLPTCAETWRSPASATLRLGRGISAFTPKQVSVVHVSPHDHVQLSTWQSHEFNLKTLFFFVDRETSGSRAVEPMVTMFSSSLSCHWTLHCTAVCVRGTYLNQQQEAPELLFFVLETYDERKKVQRSVVREKSS